MSQLSSEYQPVKGAGVQGLGHDQGVCLGICGLGAFGDLKVLDEYEETNRLVVVGMVEGHVDNANTRFICLVMVEVAVVIVVTAVLGAGMDIIAWVKEGVFLFFSPCIVFCLLDGSCFSSWILLPFFSWKLVVFGVAVY